MNLSQFKDLWVLMSKYTFELDSDIQYEDLLCIICEKLMVDACQSVCGCRYCHKCIVAYLGDNDKFCPGGKTECNDEYLKMETDVSRISRINKKISKLKVLCPNHSCAEKIELMQMCEHLRMCTEQFMQCPYAIIGCGNREETTDRLLAHFNNDALAHTQLLIEWIRNLRNEVNGLKEYVEKNKFKMSSLEVELRLKDKMNKEIAELISEQRREMNSIKDTQLREIIEQMMEQKTEIKYLQEESLKKQNRITEVEEELRKLRNQIEIVLNTDSDERKREAKKRKRNVDNDVINQSEDFQAHLYFFKQESIVESERFDNDEEKRKTNWINLCFNKSIDFVWKVNDLSKKRVTMRKKRIFSEAFYSNNYKLCLCLYIDNDDKISLCCYIMKGENDDKVQWPMKRTVTFSIINQDTLVAFKTATCNYDTYGYNNAFDRPLKDSNDYGIGIWPFIDYSSIINSPSVMVNDSIVVSCVLDNS